MFSNNKQPISGTIGFVCRVDIFFEYTVMTDGNSAFSYEHKPMINITNKSTAIHYMYISM